MSTPSIQDVPCGSCCEGYDGLHLCDAPTFCPCDRSAQHGTLADCIDELERECKVGPYAVP